MVWLNVLQHGPSRPCWGRLPMIADRSVTWKHCLEAAGWLCLSMQRATSPAHHIQDLARICLDSLLHPESAPDMTLQGSRHVQCEAQGLLHLTPERGPAACNLHLPNLFCCDICSMNPELGQDNMRSCATCRMQCLVWITLSMLAVPAFPVCWGLNLHHHTHSALCKDLLSSEMAEREPSVCRLCRRRAG